MVRFFSLTKITVPIYRRAVFSLTAIRWNSGNSNASTENGAQNDDQLECRSRLPVLTMYTKDNCSLCDQAKSLLETFEGLQFELKEIDITVPENKKWFDKYKYDIPVFHFNGEYLMRHKMHEELLRKKLRDFENESKDTE